MNWVVWRCAYHRFLSSQLKKPRCPVIPKKKFVKQIAKDLEEALTGINTTPAARGRIGKGGVLAIKMREALYYGEWQKAKEAAQAIIDLKQYELEPDYSNLFKLTGTDSKEVIIADQRIPPPPLIHSVWELSARCIIM